MTLTPEALEEIKARVEAATRGPWLDMDGGGEISDRPAHVVTRADSGTPWFICDLQDDLGDPPEGWEDTSTGPGGCPVANAAFIAHARQDVPTLIKALEDRDAEIERLREAASTYYVRYCQDEAGVDGVEATGCSENQQQDARYLAASAGLDWRKAHDPNARAAMDGGA